MVGAPTSFHVSHQVGSMHLHDRFGDSDVVSNLFVQPTVSDLDHDLTLGTLVGRKLEQFLCGKPAASDLPSNLLALEITAPGKRAVRSPQLHRCVPVLISILAVTRKVACPSTPEFDCACHRPRARSLVYLAVTGGVRAVASSCDATALCSARRTFTVFFWPEP
jgi:hypothetical protein